MGYGEDMARAVRNATSATKEVFVGTVLALHESIKVGSPVTGAPGQPVDTGNLRNSWGFEFDSDTSALISTPVEYAAAVEDGVGPHGPVQYGNSGVGGSHSVALTVMGAPRVVELEAERVARLRGGG